jgi:hypothetical protein
VIRLAKFTQSKAPYAVDLGSFVPRRDGTAWSYARISAVWFRRRRGGWDDQMLTVACAGYISECLIDPAPRDAADFLERMTDGRYGGNCEARWDGYSLWTEPGWTEEARARMLAILRPMLDNHPAIPPGYDGWYSFRA